VVHFFGPFLYRSAFGSSTAHEEGDRALAHLADTIAFEGPATIAAVVLETIAGTAGVIEPPDGYLAGVRALCDANGILLVLDEVMCGFGRAGNWFAHDAHGVAPDLVTFAKGVNSGYVPLGGVVINEAICATFNDRVYPGGLTYSGHPLACAAAVATIEAMQDERIVENARRIGDEVLRPGLEELATKHKIIGDVRGLGVFFALDLVSDRASKEPLAPYGGTSPAINEILAASRKENLFIFNNYHRLHVVPPCTITDDEARDGLARLDRALSVADKYYVGV
jgi:taurine--2-oxoglutarate transaminase